MLKLFIKNINFCSI